MRADMGRVAVFVVLVAVLVLLVKGGAPAAAVHSEHTPAASLLHPYSDDHVRASIPKPGAHFTGRDAGEVATVLNRHLSTHAERFGHSTRPCADYAVEELQATILGYLRASTADASQVLRGRGDATPEGHGAPATSRYQTQYYASRRDYRSLRHTTIDSYAAEWEMNREALRQNETLRALSRDGLCYEAALIYVHHLTNKVKQSFQTHASLAHLANVPLLPNSNVALAIHSALQITPDTPRSSIPSPASASPQHSKASHEDLPASQLSRMAAMIEQQVGDQVVCARCHLMPNSTFAPRQNTYVSPLTHPVFEDPPVRSSTDGYLGTELKVTTTRLHGPVTMNMRSYEGRTPGPTLRVKAGDTINITLTNALEEPLSCLATRSGAGPDANFYRCPNVTNLHIHGLWTDIHDVYSAIFPGETKTLIYVIPPDHHAGTNWYHPHFHGSVSLQLANGMAGAVIIEDDPATLPASLAAMDDHVMIMQSIEYFNYTMLDIKCPYDVIDGVEVAHCHNLDGAGSLQTLRRFASDKLPLNVSIIDPDAGYPLAGNYFTVNGLFQPRVSLDQGEWQRWRLVNAAHQASVTITLPDCNFRVLAMDGVYLRSPRSRNESRPLVLAPGARGDVAVQCTKSGLYYLKSVENPDMLNLGQQEGFNSGILALVDVSTTNKSMEGPPDTLPRLPKYLQDTQHETPTTYHTVKWDIVKLINNSAGLTDVPIYGVSDVGFNASGLPNLCVESNSGVAEWTIVNPIWICNATTPDCAETMNRTAASGAGLNSTYMRPVALSHGFHMHTFKYQVVGDSNGGDSYDYEVGDWRDTVTTPMAGHVRVRWRPTTYEGLVPFHCHMSPHSDRGMIATAQVQQKCTAKAPWSPKLTNYTMPITTSSREAQQLFDEGVQLTFGFAHDAAVAVFNRSIQADPTCAMCHWGLAYASGPVINVPICGTPACGQGYSAAMAAKSLSSEQKLTQKEQLLIDAIALRYSNDSAANQSLLFEAYAQAMGAIPSLIASDADVAAFYSESVMMLHCSIGVYHFYDKNGDPVPDIKLITAVLEKALTLPTRGLGGMHPLAEHLYMHITEPSKSGYGKNSAGRSVAQADDVFERFQDTQWQHIQHMSGHIYLRVGRYGDVVTANKRAHASDATWLKNNVLPYGPAHNVAFLIYGACMDGQSAVAKEYGFTLVNIYQDAPDRPDGPGPDLGWNIPLTTFLRFGDWSGALSWSYSLSMPRDWPYQRVLAYYARGVAFAHTGNVTGYMDAQQQLLAVKKTLTGRYANYAVVAENLLLAAILTSQGNFSHAINAAYTAATEQASWPYDEPPDFHMPSRQCYGQALLNAKRWTEAVAAFQADLDQFPANGYSLYGTVVAMSNDPSTYSPQQVASAKAALAKVWVRADYTLTSSCEALHF